VELILVRHGLPEHVESEDGTPADPPLAARGRAQAEAMARWLAAEEIDAVYASPMRRARETAEPLARAHGLELRLEPDVVEMDHDSPSYVPLDQLKRTDYPRWQALIQGGELWAAIDLPAFRKRALTALERAIAAHPGGRVVVVCHGGIINAWAGHLLGIEAPFFLDADYASIHRFLAAGSGERSVKSLNEAGHLRTLA